MSLSRSPNRWLDTLTLYSAAAALKAAVVLMKLLRGGSKQEG